MQENVVVRRGERQWDKKKEEKEEKRRESARLYDKHLCELIDETRNHKNNAHCRITHLGGDWTIEGV